VEKQAQLKVKMEKEQQTQHFMDSKQLRKQQRNVKRELGALAWSIFVSHLEHQYIC